jgi:hypothetical protein
MNNESQVMQCNREEKLHVEAEQIHQGYRNLKKK